MSLVKSGQAIAPTFTITSPAGTGLVDADSLPTGTVYVNGVANGAVVTVTNLATGKYKASVTLPSLSAGDTVELMISATISGKAHADVVWKGIGDTVRLSDLATTAALAAVAGYVDTEVASILSAVTDAATSLAAIKAKTDNLPADPADQSQVEAAITAAQGALAILIGALNDIAAADVWAALDDASANKVADHVLRRSWATAAGSADGDTLTFRSLLGAVAKLVNRVGISGATLTVYEDDDTTALGEQTLTSDADAEPITGVNTV